MFLLFEKTDTKQRLKRKLLEEQNEAIRPKKFVDGEEFFYLGEIYKLYIVNQGGNCLRFSEDFFLPVNLRENARQVFIDWYKDRAREIIAERVNLYCAMTGYNFSKINITNAEQRWGSCGTTQNLNFTWRLIMAPLKVIDYIVVHEIVHLKEKNHSSRCG